MQVSETRQEGPGTVHGMLINPDQLIIMFL